MQVDKVKKLNFTCDLADNSKIEANCNQTLFSSFSTSYFFPFTTFFKSYFRARISFEFLKVTVKNEKKKSFKKYRVIMIF